MGLFVYLKLSKQNADIYFWVLSRNCFVLFTFYTKYNKVGVYVCNNSTFLFCLPCICYIPTHLLFLLSRESFSAVMARFLLR